MNTLEQQRISPTIIRREKKEKAGEEEDKSKGKRGVKSRRGKYKRERNLGIVKFLFFFLVTKLLVLPPQPPLNFLCVRVYQVKVLSGCLGKESVNML